MIMPRGVRYEWRPDQSVDYQIFPEEFFSGADVSIYFGDTWIDDLTSIQFEMIEQVQPIYGYASYTWDAVARGQRLIQGWFTIAFREAGYLNNLVLDHIAQLKDPKPAMAYLMDQNAQVTNPDGTLIPMWQARARERIEELLNRYHAPVKRTETRTELVVPTWPDLKPGDPLTPIIANELIEALTMLKDAAGQPYLKYTGETYTRLEGDLLQAVQRLQQDKGLNPSGYIGIETKVLMALPRQIKKVTYDEVSLANRPVFEAGLAKTRLAAYEAEVWGLAGSQYQDIPLRAMRRFKPYWYSGKYTQNLKQKGFDIYFSFGALDAAVAAKGYKQTISNVPYHDYTQVNGPSSGITVPTTVKALRNVQIQSVAMLLDTSGNPVQELYAFQAQDMD